MKQLEGTPRQDVSAQRSDFSSDLHPWHCFGLTASEFREVMHRSPLAIGFLVAMSSLSGAASHSSSHPNGSIGC
ncbi:MAG TPA: hypothetical protein VMB85_12560 [Bryobacteraceae bacterium]|jgi:hypothetical protein|nr:hypothetical protein [Bryobacteraceae bacterium]